MVSDSQIMSAVEHWAENVDGMNDGGGGGAQLQFNQEVSGW